MRRHMFLATVSLLILPIIGGAYAHGQISVGAASVLEGRSAPSHPSRMAVPNNDTWTSGGPYGSYVNSLAMAATDPDIIYAGTDGGVFKTTDGADTWTRTGFPNILVWIVQVAPHAPDTVYAGTDDGVWKSTDGGSTWTQKGLSGARVNTLVIDPHNPHVLYAGTGERWAFWSGEIVGIFKSTDGGETWQEKLSAGLDAVLSLLVDSGNSSYIYAGVSPDLAEGRDGLRKSTDGGESWESVHVASDFWNSEYVIALAIAPAGADSPAAYAARKNSLEPDVYKSQDRGKSWTPMDAPGVSVALAVDPNDTNIMYTGKYKTTDGGDTWSEKGNGLPPGSPSSIAIDPRNSAVYVGLSSGGMYKSTDGAESP